MVGSSKERVLARDLALTSKPGARQQKRQKIFYFLARAGASVKRFFQKRQQKRQASILFVFKLIRIKVRLQVALDLPNGKSSVILSLNVLQSF